MKLRDVGEDRLLEQLLGKRKPGRGVVLGPGDDCAIVESGKPGVLQLLKTDCLVEGVHFTGNDRPERVGWKSMARPVSMRSRAAAAPINGGMRFAPPQPGTMPIITSGRPMRVLGPSSITR